jgi:hypothetical protein
MSVPMTTGASCVLGHLDGCELTFRRSLLPVSSGDSEVLEVGAARYETSVTVYPCIRHHMPDECRTYATDIRGVLLKGTASRKMYQGTLENSRNILKLRTNFPGSLLIKY